MDLIGPELYELSAHEFENLPYLTLFTLSFANIDQSVPNFGHNIYIAIKSWMSLIMGQIESENWELFALEFGKIAESDFVYTPASTNRSVSTKLGQNVYDHQISDKFCYGCNQTRTLGVI